MSQTFQPYKEIETDLLEYFVLLKGLSITLGIGTEHEMTVLTELLPALDEWRDDPHLTAWMERVPPQVAEAWRRIRDARHQQVEETMAMFDDDSQTD
jgi:RimJ/RimL family protein N-acetyltransferase